MLPQAVAFDTITVRWDPAAAAPPFSLALYSGGASGTLVFSANVTASASGQVYTFRPGGAAADYVLVSKPGGAVRIAELEGYEAPAALAEACPTAVTPSNVRGPAVATFVQRDSPPFYAFANWRWDQLTHVFYGPLTPSAAGFDALSPCELSYLRSLACWAHAFSVKVGLTISVRHTQTHTHTYTRARMRAYTCTHTHMIVVCTI